MLGAAGAHELVGSMINVRNRAGAIWINMGNGIEAQVYGILCKALSVKPQKVRR